MIIIIMGGGTGAGAGQGLLSDLSRPRRVEVGQQCKALIDCGRVLWLRSLGLRVLQPFAVSSCSHPLLPSPRRLRCLSVQNSMHACTHHVPANAL